MMAISIVAIVVGLATIIGNIYLITKTRRSQREFQRHIEELKQRISKF